MHFSVFKLLAFWNFLTLAKVLVCPVHAIYSEWQLHMKNHIILQLYYFIILKQWNVVILDQIKLY